MNINKSQQHRVIRHRLGSEHHILETKTYNKDGDTCEIEVVMFTDRREIPRLELED